jgi:hypothetical protein
MSVGCSPTGQRRFTGQAAIHAPQNVQRFGRITCVIRLPKSFGFSSTRNRLSVMFFANKKERLRKWLSAAFHRWDARGQLMTPRPSRWVLFRLECHGGDLSEQQLRATTFSMLCLFGLGELDVLSGSSVTGKREGNWSSLRRTCVENYNRMEMVSMVLEIVPLFRRSTRR